MMSEMLDKLRLPFHPSHVSWKAGTVKGDRALAMPYADLRAYMNRLDEVCGYEWSVSYEPWGEDRIICRLTIAGVTRASTGEMSTQDEKNEIGGTVAEAQAFKRACTMFGLGRYLYNLPSGWVDYDPGKKQFTDRAKTKLTGMLVQHYRRATESKSELPEIYAADDDGNYAGDRSPTADIAPSSSLLAQFNALGQDLYGDQWEQVSRRNAKRISGGKTEKGSELTPEQLQQLIDGLSKIKGRRQPTQNGSTTPQQAQGATKGNNTPTDTQNGTEDKLATLRRQRLTVEMSDLERSHEKRELARIDAEIAKLEQNGTASFYVPVFHQMTGKEYDFVNWIQALHRKDEPCSDAQYRFLTGIVDDLTNKQHNYALSVLCQSDVSSANKPSRMAAKALLRHLQKEVNAVDENKNEIKDDEGKNVKVANLDYRQDFAEIVTAIAAQQAQADGAMTA